MDRTCGLTIEHTYPPEPVPLESIDVKALINNSAVDVSCTYIYKNSSKELLQTNFIFPLDSNSAVYAFEAVVGNKHFVAKCRERVEAEKTYQEAVEKGHTAFMMQQDERMGDTFKMQIGNVPPHEIVKITLKYFDQLRLRKVDPSNPRHTTTKAPFVSLFALPTVLNARYQPASESIAHNFEPISAESKLQKKPSSFAFSAELIGGSELLNASSDSTKFLVDYTSKDRKQATIRLDGEHDLSKDFELELTFSDTNAFSMAYEKGSSESDKMDGILGMDCLMANFVPKFDSKIDERCEVIFVIDRSGSMSGGQIEKAKQSLLLFLKSLPESCRFQIVGFGSTCESLFPQPQDYTEESYNRALGYQKSLQANMGGTEVLQALKSVYDVPLTGAGWSRRIIFLTDGDVFNQDEVIALVKSNQNTSSLFAIGLGDGVSTSLVQGVARAGRGKAVFVRNSNQLTAATMEILQHALQPCPRDVKVTWEVTDDSGVSMSVCTVPSHLPPLLSDSYFTVIGLVSNPNKKELQGQVTLSYMEHEKEQKTLVAGLPPSTSSGQTLLHRQAAKLQTLELVDEHSTQARLLVDGENESLVKLRQQIVNLSVSTNVICPFTAFVGVDPDVQESTPATPPYHIPTATRVPPVMAYCHSAATSKRVPLRGGGIPLFASVNKCASHNFKSLFNSSSRTASSAGGGMPEVRTCSKSASSAIRDSSEATDAGPCMTGDAVIDLAELQSFSGSWSSLAPLATIFNVTELKLPSFEVAESVWATACVLAYLALRETNRKAEWEMMAKKAVGWLQKQVTDRSALDNVTNEADRVIRDLLKVSK